MPRELTRDEEIEVATSMTQAGIDEAFRRADEDGS
jgi:hypothetical protein